MADTVNTLIFDQLIQHQIYLERFKTGELSKLQVFLQQLMDDVSGQLGARLSDAKNAGTVRNARLEALLKDIGELSDKAAEQMADATRDQLKDLASYEGGYLVAAARAVLPSVVSFEAVAPVQLWAAVEARPFQGRVLDQWFGDYSAAQRGRIDQAIRTSVVEGETVDQTIQRLRGTRKLGYGDGIINGINRRSAEAIARTAINHTVTMARQQTLVENQAVVSSVQWRSTLDGQTSEICIARDGQTYPLESGPRPPAHPNCRSTIVPVIKSWKELGIDLKEAEPGTRASMNGQVPAAETYGTWLKRQPAAFQDDVLGAEKAQAFRSGKLTVQQFVDDKKGRAYSLGELKKLHPEAF